MVTCKEDYAFRHLSNQRDTIFTYDAEEGIGFHPYVKLRDPKPDESLDQYEKSMGVPWSHDKPVYVSGVKGMWLFEKHEEPDSDEPAYIKKFYPAFPADEEVNPVEAFAKFRFTRNMYRLRAAARLVGALALLSKRSQEKASAKRAREDEPIVHVLVGGAGTGKTTWVEKEGKVECHGFEEESVRRLLKRGTPLGNIAISTKRLPHLQADSSEMETMASDFIRSELEGVLESEFSVSVLFF